MSASATEIAPTPQDPGDSAPPHPAAAEIELAAVLHALSDPVRLKIVAALASGEERTCSSIDLPVVKSTCTHHFRVLREAGVIRVRLEGKTRLNSLRRSELEQRFPGLVDAVLGGAGASASADS
jgi:DNA-binding transcriptional ArsR family regulator